MRKILTIALVLGGVFVNVMASPIKTVGETDMGNVMVIHGLHVSLPSDMKKFPVELVPLP
jgi:hypothetical protein